MRLLSRALGPVERNLERQGLERRRDDATAYLDVVPVPDGVLPLDKGVGEQVCADARDIGFLDCDLDGRAALPVRRDRDAAEANVVSRAVG